MLVRGVGVFGLGCLVVAAAITRIRAPSAVAVAAAIAARVGESRIFGRAATAAPAVVVAVDATTRAVLAVAVTMTATTRAVLAVGEFEVVAVQA